jgi:hypothetical protein
VKWTIATTVSTIATATPSQRTVTSVNTIVQDL